MPSAAIDLFVRAAREIGYRPEAVIRDYQFSDVLAAGFAPQRQVHLAAFTQVPPSYRSAAFAVADATGRPDEETVHDLRSLGAPLLFLLDEETARIWQVSSTHNPRPLGKFSVADVSATFSENVEYWNPQSIHRAKALGAQREAFQLSFVDIGLLPAIEGEIHSKLDRLLNDALDATGLTSRRRPMPQQRAIFRGVFRLLAAKILLDRQHKSFLRASFDDAVETINEIDNFYNLDPDPEYPRLSKELQAAWTILRRGLNVANVSADDLAFVYENTLVTTESRQLFGTHSTPKFVAEYIVNTLELWNDGDSPPSVFEPFTGAGVFLLSALRHMKEGFPVESTEQQRHDVLIKKIRGAEVDLFACEVARLSLILADYPLRNGWNVENVDLFLEGQLESRVSSANVVLCNPPFELFNDRERRLYPIAARRSVRKAQFVLDTILKVAPERVGIVMPRKLITGSAYRSERKLLHDTYTEIEIVDLPDGVFSVSQLETALVIARKGNRIDARRIRSAEVSGRDLAHFAATGRPSVSREMSFRQGEDTISGEPWITPLEPLWAYLKAHPRLGSLFDVHRGIEWQSGHQKHASRADAKAGYERGLHLLEGFCQFALPATRYLDVRPRNLRGGAINYDWRAPKIVMNAIRQSRGRWRVSAAVDRSGLVLSQQYFGLWPRDATDLDAMAAIINGPLANAFLTERNPEKGLVIADVNLLPLPAGIPAQLGELVRRYSELLSRAKKEIDQLNRLIDEIDALVLRAYDLPPRLERALLASFAGQHRPLAHQWQDWAISPDEPCFSLSDRRSGTLARLSSGWASSLLTPLPDEEAELLDQYGP